MTGGGDKISPDQLWATFSDAQKKALVNVAAEFLKEGLETRNKLASQLLLQTPSKAGGKSVASASKEAEPVTSSKSASKSDVPVKKTIEKAPAKPIKTEITTKKAASSSEKQEKQVSKIVFESFQVQFTVYWAILARGTMWIFPSRAWWSNRGPYMHPRPCAHFLQSIRLV
jgi:hypothetical protein